MRKGIFSVAAVLALACALPVFADPPAGSGYQLRFSDTFQGNALDPLKWNYNFPWSQITPNSSTWVQPQNVSVNNGTLSITATNQSTGGQSYTSGAINTSGLLNFTYGYVEARLKMPQTVGAWPAFWMLQSGWPPEIDVEESPFSSYASMYNYDATYHWGTSSNAYSAGSGSYYTGVDTTAAFHNYGALWTPQGITFYFDGTPISTVSSSSADIAQAQNMYLILNLAIGGWPGNPPSWATFPTSLQAQWVKVWQLPAAQNQTMTWNYAGYGYWDNASDWIGGVPTLASQTAYFGNVNSSWAWAAWSGSRTVGNLVFDSNVGYTIGNTNTTSIMLASDTGTSNITADVYNGTQPNAPWIDSRLELYNNVNVNNYLNSNFQCNGNVIGTGTLAINAGGVDLHGALSSTGNVTIDNGGTLNVYGSVNTPGNDIDVTTAAGSSGTLTVENGATVDTGVIRVGGYNGGAARYNQLGGTVNTLWFVVGQSGAADGTATIDGGTLNVRPNGTTGDLEVGVFNGASGSVTLNGGSVNLLNMASIVLGSQGTSGNGTFTQNGGAVTFYADGGNTVGGGGILAMGRNGSSGTYTYNLNGGTFEATGVLQASGTAIFNFNGGTFVAAGNTTNLFAGSVAVNDLVGGATVNTNGYQDSISQSLTGAGGLVKNGAGNLILLGAARLNGAVQVNGGTLTLAAGGEPFVIGGVGVQGYNGAALDVANNSVTINYGATSDNSTVRAALAEGYANGAWTGNGIRSATAAESKGAYTLGYADGADGVVAGLSAGQELIKLVLPGDADMDGKVDFNDFLILQLHFGRSGMNWDQGDFDYNGTVNFNDFLLLQLNFGKSMPGVAAPVITAAEYAQLQAFGASLGSGAVPEPATLVLMGAGCLALRRRSRRSETVGCGQPQ